MSEDRNFLARWSRRKREAARETAKPLPNTPETPAEKPAEQPPARPAELPPVENLNFESDFTAYLAANVEEGVKRAALKKLFSDPRFNVMDGLDTYIDDYTKNDPIPEEMLKTLEHARSTFLGLEQEPKGEPKAQTAEADSPAAQPEARAGEDDNKGPRGDTRQDA
jgi:Protein of unknown function (DUF3306)